MYIRVKEGETADEIACRAGCPLCMLLRANGLVSGAWLEMMKEVRVPDPDECRKSMYACPNVLSKGKIPLKKGYIVQKGDDADTIARINHLPLRIVMACCLGKVSDGKVLFLPERTEKLTVHTVGVCETWKDFKHPEDLMLLNMHFAPLYPGMKILIKKDMETNE